MSAFCYALNIHYQKSVCESVNSSEAFGKPRPIPEIKSSSKKDWRNHGVSYCIAHSNQHFPLKDSLHLFWAGTGRAGPTQLCAKWSQAPFA